MGKATEGPSILTIKPSSGWLQVDWGELWEYRQLAYFLVWRDVKVRYKQTVMGVSWAIMQPFALMIVFTLFFGTLARMPSEGIPYPLFAYVGLLPWQVFSRSITDASNSLVKDQRLITRTYFPRMILPAANILAALVDFAVASILLIGMMLFYGITPSLGVIWLIVFVILMLTTSLGIGFWLSALNLEYRDITYILPFLNQFLLFLTPVVYPTSLVSQGWQVLYGLNPMVGVVEGFRWALLGAGSGPSPMLLASTLVSLLLFLSGIAFFRRRERGFADILGSGGA